jgi:SEC-C motif-containing protein
MIAERSPSRPTPEALMRSRYTAYGKRNYIHLERSLSAAQRADFSPADAKTWAESSEWLGLEIRGTTGGGPEENDGTVSFVATFRTAGEERKHVENARFIREHGVWVYDGQVVEKSVPVRHAEPKPGRNDPCPCGSGKKYKKCHGA